MEKLLENLRKRHFDPYYFDTREEAIEKIMELIPKEASCSWGGSVTIDSLGIKEMLKERGNKLFDRATGKTPEEATKIMQEGLSADFFLMSSNALTEDGVLFNIDGRGNRLAALCFGPKNVIVVVGKNKIVKDFDSAYDRVRNYVAPKNATRLSAKTPCTVTNKCEQCFSPDCICSQMVATRLSKPQGKIKVIIINEELGF